MKSTKLLVAAAIAAAASCAVSCDDSKSYAELLNDEAHYINSYLVDNIVVPEVPADTVFETGENAPYYKLDEDGNLYMQVINPGTEGNKVKYDEVINFRFMRYDMRSYDSATGTFSSSWGNEEDLSIPAASFRYQNFQLATSAQWGAGIQMPLSYLPVDCEVNLIVKSRYGFTDEEANVVPYLYHLRY
ncbi:MAG: DUF4827 domain-containing protein, partial [Muribaculaceae bacterium]|nr:DUF4827 domain-containing protein [Muribaculaceae bacterium]